jgi:hypothetical protein
MDSIRGIIRNRVLATRIRDYSKLRIRQITPTDIDCFVELQNKGYWIMELKTGKAKLVGGQRLALERLVDDLTKTKKLSILVVAQAPDDNKDIDAANCFVSEYKWQGKWISPTKQTKVIEIWEWWSKMFMAGVE